jgi:diguanylate cyclase (GGDEF)-like protein/PAS domain S-box-containing protein
MIRPDVSSNTPKPPFWRVVWRWLTALPPGLPLAKHFRARLLTGLLLVIVAALIAIFPLIVNISSFASSPLPSLVFIGMTLAFLVAYAFTRTLYLEAAAWITVLVTVAGAWAFAYLDRSDSVLLTLNLMFLFFPIYLSGLILSTWATAGLVVVNLALLLILPNVLTDPAFGTHYPTLFIFLALSFLLTVVASALRQHDQAEIQRQSQALIESEERFQLVSYATSDIVWDWDLVTDKVWWNQNIRRLLGSKTEVLGTTVEWWESLIHPEDREKFDASIRGAIASSEKFWSGEYRLRNHKGEYINIFDRAYILYGEKRKPLRMVGGVMDITERKRVEEALRELSVRDPLTGLFNRRYLEETLNRELWRAARSQRTVGVIMIDIDHFKRFNDAYGHATGDTLLREVGGFLNKNIRGSDIVCRYGGEEFTIILPDATLEITQRRAEFLRHNAKQLKVQYEGEVLEALTISLGVAGFPTHGITGPEILAAADAALYEAKEQGRDQVVVREAREAEKV